MNTATVLTIVAIVVQSVIAIAALLFSWRAASESRASNKTAQKLDVSVDGRLTQLLEMTAKVNMALGVTDGLAQAKMAADAVLTAATAAQLATALPPVPINAAAPGVVPTPIPIK